MAWLAAAAPYITLFTAGKSAAAQKQQGILAEERARDESRQLERQAIATDAEAQREMLDEKKKASLLMSRAKAVSAASGAGANDPTVENILGRIDDEGEYRALSSLYSGKTDSDLARAQAGATRRTGRAKRYASKLDASTTMLSGLSSFAQNYG